MEEYTPELTSNMFEFCIGESDTKIETLTKPNEKFSAEMEEDIPELTSKTPEICIGENDTKFETLSKLNAKSSAEVEEEIPELTSKTPEIYIGENDTKIGTLTMPNANFSAEIEEYIPELTSMTPEICIGESDTKIETLIKPNAKSSAEMEEDKPEITSKTPEIWIGENDSKIETFCKPNAKSSAELEEEMHELTSKMPEICIGESDTNIETLTKPSSAEMEEDIPELISRMPEICIGENDTKIETVTKPKANSNAEVEEEIHELTSKMPDIYIGENDTKIKTLTKLNAKSTSLTVLPDKSKSEIIERLGVIARLDCKLTECEIITTVGGETSTNNSSEGHIIINFLKRLFLLDYRTRQMHSLGVEAVNAAGTTTIQDRNSKKSRLLEFLQKSHAADTMAPSRISAADIMFCALHCSDRFLQQDICEKLALCQLAVPVIIPPLEGTDSMYLLWGCRKIVKKWKTHVDQEISKEDTVVNHGLFNVAVMRLGDNANCMSKSKVLNHMLGKCQGSMQHDYFLYRECDSQRKLSNGVVEACWFLPEGNSGEIIPDIVCFLNLRGDGIEFKKQHDFLCQSAGLTIIFTDRGHLESHTDDVMKISELCKLVLVVDAGQSGTPDSDFRVSDSLVVVDGKGRSVTEISIKLCTMVVNSIEKSSNLYNLRDLAEFARNVGIGVDEDEEPCLGGKRLAAAMMHRLADLPLGQAKERCVPLQGQHWIDWANHDKEKSRLEKKAVDDSIEIYLDKLESKMKNCRKAQVSNGISEEMILLTIFLQKDKILKKYFLRFLQINLDNLSRSNLPPLYIEYNALKLEVRQLEQRLGHIELNLQTSKDIATVQVKELGQLKEELEMKKQCISKLMNGFMSNSFGLEHYLRELAQLYEAYAYACPNVVQVGVVNLSLLPDFMADLILDGYPIELMDGSASHIPIKWVTAVLNSLRSKLGDVRVFVLSVIGVESSGKSTMLNTMFGLRFAVSSGRCTRGVFAQLLMMDDTLSKKLNCDCMLVLDTEGLRSPELSFSETYRHDNEIATFVICLAHLTLINIGGQTLGNDMTDILQISAHAFIRMKEVEFNSKCMFVNQNVADSAAGNKKAQGMESLLSKLDEMTQAAAEEEGMLDKYWTFSQVFPLILNEKIQFIPGLWQGGMSPPNPLYSEKLGKLRTAILQEIQDGIPLSTFISRLGKLWEAVKEENFIFSFQNSLVIREHSQLQHLYGKWTAELSKSVMEWELKAKQKLMMTSRDELDTEMQTIQSDLEAVVSREKDNVQEQLDKYFESSRDNNVSLIIRFKTEFEQDLVRLSKHLIDNALATCNTVYNMRDQAPQAEILIQSYRDRLFKKAQDAASQLREKELVKINKDNALNDSDLQLSFDMLYKQLLTQAERDNPTTRIQISQIKRDAGKVIFDKFPSVQRKSLSERYKHVNNILTIKSDQHFQRVSWYDPRKWLQILRNKDNSSTAKKFLDEIMLAVERLLGNTQIDEIGYKPEHLEQVVSLILNMITDFKDPNKCFSFTKNFKVDVVLHVMSFAPQKLHERQQIYESSHSLTTCIAKERDSLYEEYIAFYMGTTHDVLAASRIAGSILEDSLTAHMNDLLGNRLFDKIMKYNVFRSKLDLNGTILADLAHKGDFKEYISYIRKYTTFVGEWILKYVAKVCLETVKTDKGVMTAVQHIADQEIMNLVREIKHAMNETTTSLLDKNNATPSSQKVPPFTQWIKLFTSNVQTRTLLYFHNSSLDSVSGYAIQNYEYFTQHAVDNCLSLSDRVKEMLRMPHVGDSETEAKSFVERLTQKVHSRLFSHVIGCGKSCPFCEVPCDLQTLTHDKHKSELHRPQGINNYTWEGSNKLVSDICTSLVASNCRYRFHDSEEWRSYKDYATEFPAWFIQSIKDADATVYWKWVFKTFNKEFAAHYGAKPADLPKGWDNITKEQALASLKATYHM